MNKDLMIGVVCSWIIFAVAMVLVMISIKDIEKAIKSNSEYKMKEAYLKGIAAEQLDGPPWKVKGGDEYVLSFYEPFESATITRIYPGLKSYK